MLFFLNLFCCSVHISFCCFCCCGVLFGGRFVLFALFVVSLGTLISPARCGLIKRLFHVGFVGVGMLGGFLFVFHSVV